MHIIERSSHQHPPPPPPPLEAEVRCAGAALHSSPKSCKQTQTLRWVMCWMMTAHVGEACV